MDYPQHYSQQYLTVNGYRLEEKKNNDEPGRTFVVYTT